MTQTCNLDFIPLMIAPYQHRSYQQTKRKLITFLATCSMKPTLSCDPHESSGEDALPLFSNAYHLPGGAGTRTCLLLSANGQTKWLITPGCPPPRLQPDTQKVGTVYDSLEAAISTGASRSGDMSATSLPPSLETTLPFSSDMMQFAEPERSR